MIQNLRSIYKACPKWIKVPAAKMLHSLPPQYLYGSEYTKTYNFLKESESYSKDQVCDFQIKKLQEICKHAYNTVPYYKNLFDQCGFDAQNLKYFDQLDNIPYLTKQLIQENIDSMISTKYTKNQISYATTGGSTGIPMGLYSNVEIDAKENAFIHFMWSRMGYKPNKKIAVLRGSFTGKDGIIKIESRQLMLSSYHMTDDNMYKYIQALKEFKPEYMHVYASSIYILADFMKRNHILPISSIKAILVGSENVYPHQRQLVEEVMNCRLFSHYGHCERACLAGECVHSNYYHIFWQYGYTELINGKGEHATKEDEAAEIVATSFDNYAMPLIRYKTMDIACNTNDICELHSNYKLIKNVKGRLQEVLVTSTGRYISMTSINMHSDVFDNVKQFQFYQDDPAFCVFNIVKKSSYTFKDEENIIVELKKKLGNDIGLRLKYVDEIPRTISGKYRFLIQKLPIIFTEDIYND